MSCAKLFSRQHRAIQGIFKSSRCGITLRSIPKPLSMVASSNPSSISRLLPFSLSPSLFHNRGLWGYVNAVANKPDNDRIREVGAQRACAEWLLRNGAHVRWEGFDNFNTDYNKLPSGNFQKFKIVEINAEDASIMDIGFPHFDGVDTIRKIRFHFCRYVDDQALESLGRIKGSLEDLEISSCGNVTEAGLASLTQLQNLKELLLCNLPEIRNKEKVMKNLTEGLPACNIVYKDMEHKENN